MAFSTKTENNNLPHYLKGAFYDVCVVGGGPGGYVAALEAGSKGLSVALIEKEAFGGTCLQWGCIPTKTLLHSSNHYKELQEFLNKSEYSTEEPKNDPMAAMVQGSRQVVNVLEKGIHYLLKKRQVQLYSGRGSLMRPQDLESILGKENIKDFHGETLYGILVSPENGQQQESLIFASKVIMATGSRPRKLNFPDIWTAKDAMNQQKVPKSLLIVGAGVIGLEFASFYNNLGTKVTVIEYQDNFLEREEPEVRNFLLKSLEKKGIVFHFGHEILTIENKKEKKNTTTKIVTFASRHNGEKFQWKGDEILGAIGVQGNSENLGLEAYNIHGNPQGFLTVEGPSMKLYTPSELPLKKEFPYSSEGLYAIGDLTGNPCLAHKASAQGIAAVRHILWEKKNQHGDALGKNFLEFLTPISNISKNETLGAWMTKIQNQHIQGTKTLFPHDEKNPWNKPLLIPGCIYTFPQMASVGLTQDQGKNLGLDLVVGRAYFHGNGAALSQHQGEGMAITIFEKKTQRLVGGHLVGPQSSELISTLALAIHLKATASQLLSMVFPHPSLSEILGESILQAFGQDLHG